MEQELRLEQLRGWRAEAQVEVTEAQAGLSAAQQKLEACRERLRLLDRLLAMEEATAPTRASAEADEAQEGAHDASPIAAPSASIVASSASRSSDELLDACEKLVRQSGRPLHISELHAALTKSGVVIPGRGTEANLLVRLHRANGRFIRTGRGTYAPPDLGAPEVRPVHKRRVRSRS